MVHANTFERNQTIWLFPLCHAFPFHMGDRKIVTIQPLRIENYSFNTLFMRATLSSSFSDEVINSYLAFVPWCLCGYLNSYEKFIVSGPPVAIGQRAPPYGQITMGRGRERET